MGNQGTFMPIRFRCCSKPTSYGDISPLLRMPGKFPGFPGFPDHHKPVAGRERGLQALCTQRYLGLKTLGVLNVVQVTKFPQLWTLSCSLASRRFIFHKALALPREEEESGSQSKHEKGRSECR